MARQVVTPGKATIFVARQIYSFSLHNSHFALEFKLYHDWKQIDDSNKCISSLTTSEVLQHAVTLFCCVQVCGILCISQIQALPSPPPGNPGAFDQTFCPGGGARI